LPLEDGKMEVVVSGLVLNFVPEKSPALKEMLRAAKHGGTIAAYVWDYAGEMPLMRYFWNGVSELFPNGAAQDEGKQFPICKREPLADLFKAAGLNAIKTTALEAPTIFTDINDYWSPFLRGQGPAGAVFPCGTISASNCEGKLRISCPMPRTVLSHLPLVPGRCEELHE
jgi:SAM-dependent methyltransferase